MNHFLAFFLVSIFSFSIVFSFNILTTNNHVFLNQKTIRNRLKMEVKNDATARANRES